MKFPAVALDVPLEVTEVTYKVGRGLCEGLALLLSFGFSFSFGLALAFAFAFAFWRGPVAVEQQGRARVQSPSTALAVRTT